MALGFDFGFDAAFALPMAFVACLAAERVSTRPGVGDAVRLLSDSLADLRGMERRGDGWEAGLDRVLGGWGILGYGIGMGRGKALCFRIKYRVVRAVAMILLTIVFRVHAQSG